MGERAGMSPDGVRPSCTGCKDLHVAERAIQVRPARDEDRLPMADVFAAVAEERDGIATEPPVDVEARAASWTLDGTFVALVGTELLGSVHVEVSQHGFGEIGMAVSREWRGRGVGSALMVAAGDKSIVRPIFEPGETSKSGRSRITCPFSS